MGELARFDDSDLPPALRRPSEARAIATLSYEPEREGAREEIPARFVLDGSRDAFISPSGCFAARGSICSATASPGPRSNRISTI